MGWRGGGERRKVEGREGRGEEGKGEGGRKWKGSGMEGVRRKVEERKEGVCVCVYAVADGVETIIRNSTQ